MHRSQLVSFIIDCKTDNVDGAAAFWSQALGRKVMVPAQDAGHYRALEMAANEPLVEVQAVAHESRMHLDIESDDIDAEVARLEQLGAKRVEKIRTWTVMQAPTGQRFCVVRPQRGVMGPDANTWPRPGTAPAEATPFEPTPQHFALAKLVGHGSGETKTWLDPNKPPDVSTSAYHATAICGGRWVRIAMRGAVQGQLQSGEMTIGFANGVYEMSWVDSFHTGGAIFLSKGAPRQDGVIAATTTFAETWLWRTEFHDKMMRAYVTSPAGEEDLAIETKWS